MLTPEELQKAQTVLKNLQSDKYKAKNRLFLQPFDVSECPGYLDVVQKKLDLQTVSQYLQSGEYQTMEEFWKDASGIFENAIKYHSGKPTKWIAKHAKEMLKVLVKERKAVEKGNNSKNKKKASKAGTPSIKIRVKAPTQTQPQPTPTTSGPSETKKKVSLKLKLPTQQNKAESKTAVKAKPTQPKLKLKLSLNKQGSNVSKASSSGERNTKTGTSSASAGATKQSKTSRKQASSGSLGPSSAAEKSSKSSTTPKITLKLSNSRGKELPKAVAAANASSATSTSSSTTPKAASTSQVKPKKPRKTTPTVAASSPKKAFSSIQAAKILAGLRRRQNKNITWFLQPVSDKAILADYKAKIKHPMDMSTMTQKLEKKQGSYNTVSSFVLDLRRIFANCLIYNTSIKDSLRPVAVEVLEQAEALCKVFFAGSPGAANQSVQLYPPLLYCWKLCIGVLDTLYNLVNPSDGQPTALYFLYPVSYYCGGQFPPDYLEKVKKPIDFGTITSSLLEGRIRSVDDFCNDCRLVVRNCTTYYSGREDGKIYVEQANRLNDVLSKQLEQLTRYVKSPRGLADQKKAFELVVLPRPPVPLLLSVLEGIRALQYTDKATKITEPAMGPFEKPVSLAVFPDYMQYVQVPMDLQTVERKVKANLYATPEDFEYDVQLIFKNCEVYNSQRHGDHLVAMAKFGARQFRRVFYAKMRALEDPSSVSLPKADRPESSAAVADSSSTSPPLKKIKIDTSGISKGKSAPRISISAKQVSSAALSAARSKSPLDSQKKASGQPQPKANQPVPLHIAIARVKEAFPLRRAVKSLQPWEADCARYFKELSRHPWLSAARKFIFHVPVQSLFPELKEAYAAKIRKPMDLTTVECTLLAGGRYASPDDFLQDIALVFANAIRFNKDGRDVGDPLSCAYYDASVHLLRYSRWLSLEVLSQYADNSDHVDEPGPDGLPPFPWKLTSGNKKKARDEMEQIVLNEPIEKSLEGDRWTWHEAECEKLLKSLRHQSDYRYMSFFLLPNYPSDYTAFIAKPMDWEKVQRTLKKRHYDKFGDVVSDLRLIFSNALKYNARHKGTDTVSGKAYEAATYMSKKLEVAISKFLLSVSDRLERERIDHANAEREIEAEERAEEARIRAAWKKEAEKEGSTAMPTQPDASQKIRLVRRAAHRREITTDFEIPFFDEEDNGKHERSYFEVQKFQKSMFEKQRQELSKMRQCTSAIGALAFSRLLQRSLAQEWNKQEAKKNTAIKDSDQVMQSGDGATKQNSGASEGSAILNELEREGRGPLKIQFAKRKVTAKNAKRKKPIISLD